MWVPNQAPEDPEVRAPNFAKSSSSYYYYYYYYYYYHHYHYHYHYHYPEHRFLIRINLVVYVFD